MVDLRKAGLPFSDGIRQEERGNGALDRDPKHRCGVMRNIAVPLLAIAAILLEATDVVSTYHMLARGGHEQNPIVAWFMQVLGDAWPLCKLPEIAVVVILWAFVPRMIALICLGLIVAGYSFVVWHNYQI